MAATSEHRAGLLEKIRADAATLSSAAIATRRRLHQYPETGHQEFRTTAFLKKELEKLGLKIFSDRVPTGLWAQLDTGRPGPVVAVRTDIDALPITEKTRLPFASRNPGIMHACGHDVHMATLLAVARILSRRKKDLVGRIKFICQPAEEVPPGGARQLIEAGVLDDPKVDVILALHVDPSLPTGTIGLRDGVVMASVYDFDLHVIGRSGHAAMPHHTVDAITVSAEIITGLQQVISRLIDPTTPAVITFGTIRGGEARNAIAGEVALEGTARSLDLSLGKKLPRLIKKTATGIGRALGARVEVNSIARYPVLRSNARVNRFVSDAFTRVYPEGKVVRVPVVMGAEDFACFLEKIPGTWFRLGVGNKKIGADKPWHHPAFTIDEAAIPIGIAALAAAVVDLLFGWNGGPP